MPRRRLRLHGGTIATCPSPGSRDVAVVLSGGGINGVLLELGFLKRLRETQLWPRVGWIYGTSAGALAGTMAALDRLDDLEEFLLDAPARGGVPAPARVAAPRRAARLHAPGDDREPARRRRASSARRSRASEIELVVFATDLTNHAEEGETRHYELAYASHSTAPETMGRAILASAAISALVLPVTVDGVIATDGGWVRNFPLDHAYRNPRGRRDRRLPLHRELPPDRPRVPRADARAARAVPRGSSRPGAARGDPPRRGAGRARRAGALRGADRPSHARRDRAEHRARGAARGRPRGVGRRAPRAAGETSSRRRSPRRRPGAGGGSARSSNGIFASARFPFRHDRHVPTLIVRGTPGEDGLDPTFSGEPWPEERKRGLIERGYRLTDAELAANGELGREGRQGPGQAGGPLAGVKSGARRRTCRRPTGCG